jgi:hypothetical protein
LHVEKGNLVWHLDTELFKLRRKGPLCEAEISRWGSSACALYNGIHSRVTWAHRVHLWQVVDLLRTEISLRKIDSDSEEHGFSLYVLNMVFLCMS